MKLEKIIKYDVTITVKTGLHIGGSSDTVSIGAVDNPVIRNPLNDEPYIPGSSLKGKMRSLMEWHLGKLGRFDKKTGEMDYDKVHSCDDPDCPICTLFGKSAEKDLDKAPLPTRLLISDLHLSNDWKKRFENGELITEVKWENQINRITSSANPRQIERVLPDVIFEGTIVLRIFEGDKEEQLIGNLEMAKKLVELTGLGGSVSRGSGRVEINMKKSEESLSN